MNKQPPPAGRWRQNQSAAGRLSFFWRLLLAVLIAFLAGLLVLLGAIATMSDEQIETLPWPIGNGKPSAGAMYVSHPHEYVSDQPSINMDNDDWEAQLDDIKSQVRRR